MNLEIKNLINLIKCSVEIQYFFKNVWVEYGGYMERLNLLTMDL